MIGNHKSMTMQEKHTITTNPQQRTVRLPLIECTTPDKPFCCPVVLGATCSIMIDGRIWRSEPLSKLRARLVSCEHILATRINIMSGSNERRKSSITILTYNRG